MSSIINLVKDNPLIAKDGWHALKKPKMLAFLGVTALCVTLLAVFMWVDDRGLRRGDELASVMFGLSFLVAGVLLPAMASSTIAGEREHGTLPLLTVAGLSPARIVFGKVTAMLVVALPFVMMPLPFFAFGAMKASAAIEPLLIALTGLAVSTVAFAAVGVYASALNERARTSAPGALLGAGLPALYTAMPSFVLVVDTMENSSANSMRVEIGAVGGIVAGVVITAAALYGAWSALAPQSQPRFARATVLFATVTLAMPMVAGVLAWIMLVGEHGFRSDIVGAFSFGTVTSSIGALMLYSAGVARDRKAPLPAIVVVPAAFASMLGGWALALMIGMPDASSIPTSNDADSAMLLVLLPTLLAMASMSAAVSRFVKTPLLAALIALLMTMFILVVPVVADETMVGHPWWAIINFTYASPHHLSLSLVPAWVFWGAVTVVSLAIASRKR